MRMMLISDDSDLLQMFSGKEIASLSNTVIYKESNDPLDIMSTVCDLNPSLLILDDDYIKPESARILRSIRKIHKKMQIIFLTSDDSLDLGREISQLGIQFYGHKPLNKEEIVESIQSIAKLTEESI